MLREKVADEYKRRIRLILSSELSANHKLKAINTFAVPVICYTAGIVQWPLNTLNENFCVCFGAFILDQMLTDFIYHVR